MLMDAVDAYLEIRRVAGFELELGPRRQTVHLLMLGAEGGYRWDFQPPVFVSLYGTVAVPLVLDVRVGQGRRSRDDRAQSSYRESTFAFRK